jgi:hypothetical protein
MLLKNMIWRIELEETIKVGKVSCHKIVICHKNYEAENKKKQKTVHMEGKSRGVEKY